MSWSYIPGYLLQDLDDKGLELIAWEDGFMRVHAQRLCKGHACCIHNPSDHRMKDWRQHWRNDRGLMERLCPHGVGHPDPDDIAFKARTRGERFARVESIHGCDGCCSGSFPLDDPKPAREELELAA